MNIPDERSIGLTARPFYSDESNSCSASQTSSSESLLDEDLSLPSHARKSKRRTVNFPKSQYSAYRKHSRSGNDIIEKVLTGRRNRARLCLKIGGGVLLLLGVIQLFSLIGRLVVLILPDRIHRVLESWGRPGHVGAELKFWPTDFSRDIVPIPCHSHNDYWRTVPLYSAIEVGCIGVEADVWLFDEKLYVGHSVASLTPNRTINSLYIDPLLDILSRQNPKRTLFPQGESQLNGVFDTTPEQSIIFLIDFKTAGDALWPYVQSVLEPLRSRNYLTRSNGTEIVRGPITVVGTGNTPFDLVNSDSKNPHHDIFFDAPLSSMFEGPNGASSTAAPSVVGTASHLTEKTEVAPESNNITGGEPGRSRHAEKRSDDVGQGKSGTGGGDHDNFNVGNSFYASVAFSEAIGELSEGEFSGHQMDLLRGQIRGAHKRGLKARYWDLPFWPINLRNHVWDILVKEGVDLLNVDDLKGAAIRDWDKHRGW